MQNKIKWLKYFSPVFGILFCPLTILFVWSIWSGPVVDSENNPIEEIRP